MGWFSRKDKESVEVEKIFDKLATIQENMDRAISLRSLKRYDEAIELIQSTLKKYKEYGPGISVLANTIRMAGRDKDAENLIRKELDAFPRRENLILTELYAILGDIYADRKQFDNAMSFYAEALAAEPPLNSANAANYQDMLAVMRSQVFFSIANLKFTCSDFEEAARYAKKRMATMPDCERSCLIYGISIVYHYQEDHNGILIMQSSSYPSDLVEAFKALLIPIKKQHNYYLALAMQAIAIEYITRAGYFKERNSELNYYWDISKQCHDTLVSASSTDERAMQCRCFYYQGLASAIESAAWASGDQTYFRFTGLNKDGTPALQYSRERPSA